MMLKRFLTLLIIFSIYIGYSQTSNTPKFFGQCMIAVQTIEEAQELTNMLKENPYVDVVRVDWPTKRIFLTTKDISTFSESNFNSWLGEFSSLATCFQVGLHGVDQVNPYPFTNCND